jgi:hypothetical protein
MVTGGMVEECDREPLVLEGGQIEEVDEFPYLGSLIASWGGINVMLEHPGHFQQAAVVGAHHNDDTPQPSGLPAKLLTTNLSQVLYHGGSAGLQVSGEDP